MTEKELIAKIQSLEKIKPDNNWVVFTKNQILAEEERVGFFTELGLIFKSALKPAFALPLVAFFLGATIFLFSNVEELRFSKAEVRGLEQELAEVRELAFSLEQLRVDVSQAKESLEKMEMANAQDVLDAGGRIETTAQKSKEAIAKTKQMVAAADLTKKKIEESERTQILASISDTEEALGALELSYQQKVKQVTEQLIEEVEHWSLGEIDRSQFEKAKEDYLSGDYARALEEILLLGK